MVKPTIPVESSRGCWWGDRGGCTFCGLNGYGNGYRSKTPETVIRELAFLADRYHLENFEMSDNILDQTYFSTLFPMLKKAGSPYTIFYETKSNLTAKQVKSLKEAGVIWIQPGIESLSTPLLRHMNKGCMAWQNLRTLKWCRQYGIRIQWFILWDFPGEKDEWFKKMAHLFPSITHYQPPGNMLSILFNRYSLYHDKPADFGLKFTPAAPYFNVYPLPQDVIMNLAYFFEDKTREIARQNPVLSKIIAREGVSALRKELAKWLIAFKSENPPTLSMIYAGKSIHIKDTRPMASEATYKLTGMSKDIYLSCDNPCRLKELKKKIVGNRNNACEFEETMDFLMRKRLVLLADGRVMALALKEPVPTLPKINEWPGGLFTGELRLQPIKRDDC
jgi:ribosomal peptide maturation radical SAM protein 1